MSYKTYEVRVLHDGTESWWLDGKRHRENGPAITHANGTQEWWLNDERHREGGPAFTGSHGEQYWFRQGELHREDGPAVIHSNGDQSWYLNNRLHCKEDFDFKISSCNGKIVEIDGKKYQLKEV